MTYSTVLAVPIHTLVSPASTCSLTHNAVQQALQLHTTQIPDFVCMVFFVRTYEDQAWYLFSLGYQTYKKAQYIFRHDMDVKVVACIMTIGEKWVYQEIVCNDASIHQMEEEIHNSNGKDIAYSPSPEPTNSSSSLLGPLHCGVFCLPFTKQQNQKFPWSCRKHFQLQTQ